MYSTYEKYREQKGYTDYRVSMLTGISTATLSAWKKGNYVPSASRLLAIANVVGCSVEELIPPLRKEE